MRDLVLELAELGLGRQVAIDQQVGDFEETRVLGQLLNRIAAIQQHALVAVDERDRTAARRCRHETRVVGEVAGVLVELADVDRRIAQTALDDRQGRGCVRRGIGQHNGLIGHGEISCLVQRHCKNTGIGAGVSVPAHRHRRNSAPASVRAHCRQRRIIAQAFAGTLQNGRCAGGRKTDDRYAGSNWSTHCVRMR